MPEDAVDRILRRDPRYKREAYEFTLDAIRQAADSGHVTAAELLERMRELAREKFGLLARTVLTDWRVHCTEDFGHIVFNLVAEKAVGKTEDDSIEHFIEVFDFAKAFPEETGPVAIQRPRDETDFNGLDDD